MTALAHLHPSVHPIVALPREERIRHAYDEHWIRHRDARRGLETLRSILNRPRKHRVKNLLLTGESGNGKTSLVHQLREENPAKQAEDGRSILPIVIVQMPSAPNEARFWSEILTVLGVSHVPSSRNVMQMRRQVLEILKSFSCRMLVIDEVHNILTGTPRSQRQFLALLKNLSNDLQLPMVAVGTADAARALSTDPQLWSRFLPFHLASWTEDGEFRGLLGAVEKVLPLAEPSDLSGPELGPRLFRMSRGTIGGVIDVLQQATERAIRDGKEKITAKLLDDLAAEFRSGLDTIQR